MFKKTLFSLMVFTYAFIGMLFLTNNTHAVELDLVQVHFTAMFDQSSEVTTTLDFQYGQSISIDDFDTPGYIFAFWVVNGFVDYELDAGAEFLVTEDLNLIAVYHQETNYAVLFIDSNGELLKTNYVSSAEPSVVLAPEVAQFSKPGFEVNTDKTWKAQDGRTSLDGVDNNLVFTLQYNLLENTTFNIVVSGGSLSNSTPTYNDVVKVTSTIEEFTHWEENGEVVSYNQVYLFTALSSRTLEAKTGGTQTPLIRLTKDLQLRGEYESYMGQFYLPSDYQLIETGIIASHAFNPNLDLESSDVVKLRSHAIQTQTNEFLRSLESGTFGTVKGYLTYKFEEAIETIYTENKQIKTEYGVIDNFENTSLDEYQKVSGSLSADKSFTNDSYSGNRALELNIHGEGDAIFLDFLNNNKWQYIKDFDEFVIRYKAYYPSGTANNTIAASISISGGPVAGSVAQSVTLRADGQWREIVLSKSSIDMLFTTESFQMLRIYAPVYTRQSQRGNLEIIFDDFEGRYSKIVVDEETTVSLNEKLSNLLTGEFVVKYKVGDNIIDIPDLNQFAPLEDGTLIVDVNRSNKLQTQVEILVEINRIKTYSIIDDVRFSRVNDYVITSASPAASAPSVLFSDDNGNKNLMINIKALESSVQTDVKVKFNLWDGLNYQKFDYVEFKVKANFVNGSTANIGIRINSTWQNFKDPSGTQYRDNVPANGQWLTLRINKDQFNDAFNSNMFEIMISRWYLQGQSELNVYFDDIRLGYNPINAESGDTLNLLTYFGLTSEELVNATYNGEPITNLTALNLVESGELVLNISKTNYKPETIKINVTVV